MFFEDPIETMGANELNDINWPKFLVNLGVALIASAISGIYIHADGASSEPTISWAMALVFPFSISAACLFLFWVFGAFYK